MDNFERKAIGRYLIKLLPNLDMDAYEFEELTEKIIKEYKIKKSEVPQMPQSKYGRIGKKDRIFYLNNLSKLIKKNLNKIEDEEGIFKIQLDYIKDICSLNDNQYEFLLFKGLLIRTELGDSLYESMNKPVFNTFCREYLKLDNISQKQLKKELLEKGIVDDADGRANEPRLNNQITDIIIDKRINTYEKIKNTLIGKCEKSELKWNDFNHYKTERETVLNILKSAVKNKTKGINILLYGDVGTGKTQFAKMIANKAGISEYQVLFERRNREEASYKERIVDLYAKQTILEKLDNSCLLFDEAEDVFNGHYSSKAYINNILDNTPVPVFWTTNDIYHVDPAILRRMTYSVEFEKLTDDNRLSIWKRIFYAICHSS